MAGDSDTDPKAPYRQQLLPRSSHTVISPGGDILNGDLRHQSGPMVLGCKYQITEVTVCQSGFSEATGNQPPELHTASLA